VSTEEDKNISVDGLAAIINARLVAEGRIARAIAFSWLCGGVAVAACMIGLGIVFAFLGYSHLLSVKPAAEQIAQALVKALSGTELRTVVTGRMALSPNSEVNLAAGQTVTLKEGATVKLDPSSSMRVVGDLKYDLPQPSKQQLQEDTTSKGHELPFTSYTVFKSTNYGAGQVETGWNFDLSDPIRPKKQYCNYRQTISKGKAVKYTIAVDGTPHPPSPLAKLSFKFDEALSNCIWFSGM
jgi:hypothetical protein